MLGCSWSAQRLSSVWPTARGACQLLHVKVWRVAWTWATWLLISLLFFFFLLLNHNFIHYNFLSCQWPKAATARRRCCTVKCKNITWTQGAQWSSSVIKATTWWEIVWLCVWEVAPGAPPSPLANVRQLCTPAHTLPGSSKETYIAKYRGNLTDFMWITKLPSTYHCVLACKCKCSVFV